MEITKNIAQLYQEITSTKKIMTAWSELLRPESVPGRGIMAT